MPRFLGKEYTTEVVFSGSFTPETLTILTDRQEDIRAVSQVVAQSLITIQRIKTKQVKTLITISIGTILITVSPAP